MDSGIQNRSHTNREVSEIDPSHSDFSYLAVGEFGGLMTVYCIALTALGVWRLGVWAARHTIGFATRGSVRDIPSSK